MRFLTYNLLETCHYSWLGRGKNVYLPESRGHHVLGGLGRSVTDTGQFVHATELTPHSVVNTLNRK